MTMSFARKTSERMKLRMNYTVHIWNGDTIGYNALAIAFISIYKDPVATPLWSNRRTFPLNYLSFGHTPSIRVAVYYSYD